jgi:hypothetical protein
LPQAGFGARYVDARCLRSAGPPYANIRRYPARATASTWVVGQLGQFSDEGGVEQAEFRVRSGDYRQLVIGTPSVL